MARKGIKTMGTRILLRILLSACVMSGVSLAQVAGSWAQEASNVHVTELAGAEIRADPPWSFDPTLQQVDPAIDTEIVGISTRDSAVVIGYLPGFASPVEARDVFMSMFEAETDSSVQVDRGDYGSVSYSLDILEIAGEKMGVFSVFVTGRPSGYLEMTCLMAHPGTFADELASAQESIRIDGAGILAGVDGAGLQALLTSALPEASASPIVGSPEATPGGDGAADAGDLGLVEEGLYISPQFGTEVTWGPEWQLDTFLGEPLESIPFPKQDTVLLDWTGGTIAFAGVIVAEGGPQDDLGAPISDIDTGADSEVLDTRTDGDAYAVVMLMSDPSGLEMIAVMEVRCVDPACGTAVGVVVFGTTGALASAYADAQLSIAVDGKSAFTLYTPEELQVMIDQLSGTPATLASGG